MKPKLGNKSDEAMKRCDEALKLHCFNFFAIVKRFIASSL
jgi:hypothetical protein